MKELAYQVFVDIWRLTYKYHFQKLSDEKWECFITDAEKIQSKYKNTPVESLYRCLFNAIQTFYESLNK